MGRGISDQFRRGPSDIVTLEGHDGVAARVRQAIMTRAGSQRRRGEIPWRMGLGSQLDTLRHRPLDFQTLDLAAALTRRALAPLDEIENVEIRPSFDDTTKELTISVSYTVKADGRVGVVTTTMPTEA